MVPGKQRIEKWTEERIKHRGQTKRIETTFGNLEVSDLKSSFGDKTEGEGSGSEMASGRK